MRPGRWCRAAALAVGVLVCGASVSASAQESADATTEAETRARAHYERGVALFDEGHFQGALAEFEEAYELTARARLLFNIGQIHARLGHAVEATQTLERYLAEGGEIPAERRAQVETEIASQRGRIARVTVASNVEGARVSIDDVDRGTSPLASPLLVSVGEHVLVVSARGHETARERFRIAGGEERTLRVELVALAGATDTSAATTTTIAATPSPATPSSVTPTLTIVGGTVAGVGLATWASAGIVTLLEASGLTSGATACSPSCPSERLATIEVSRIVADVGLGVLGVGAVLLVVGAVLELGGASEPAGEGPHASIGPGSLEVTW